MFQQEFIAGPCDTVQHVPIAVAAIVAIAPSRCSLWILSGLFSSPLILGP